MLPTKHIPLQGFHISVKDMTVHPGAPAKYLKVIPDSCLSFMNSNPNQLIGKSYCFYHRMDPDSVHFCPAPPSLPIPSCHVSPRTLVTRPGRSPSFPSLKYSLHTAVRMSFLSENQTRCLPYLSPSYRAPRLLEWNAHHWSRLTRPSALTLALVCHIVSYSSLCGTHAPVAVTWILFLEHLILLRSWAFVLPDSFLGKLFPGVVIWTLLLTIQVSALMSLLWKVYSNTTLALFYFLHRFIKAQLF